MKKFIKNNKVSIFIFLLLIIWLIISAIQYVKQYNLQLKYYDEVIVNLSNNENVYLIERPTLPNAFYIFFDFILHYFRPLQLLAPLMIIICGVFKFHSDLKSGFFKNKLTRMSYRNYLKESMINSYKCIWILPCFVIATFVVSLIISRGNLNIYDSIVGYDYNGTDFIKQDPLIYMPYLKYGWIFYFVYLLNIFLHSIFYVNVSLISCKNNKNIFVSIILGYMIFIVLEIISEVLIGQVLMHYVFGISNAFDLFNLFNIWVYDNVISLWHITILSLIISIGSTIITILLYRNKEGVVIENEK